MFAMRSVLPPQKTSAGSARRNPLSDRNAEIADMNMSNMVSVDGSAKRTTIGVRNAMLVLVIAGTLLAAALVGPVAAGILKPLRQLTRSARQIECGRDSRSP